MNETNRETSVMNEKRLENSPMTPRKTWTEPVVTVIDLRSARNSMPATVSDSGNNNRS